MVQVITAAEAAALIRSNATIAMSGFVGCANPEALSTAMEERFVNEGLPRDLTLVFCAGQGDGKDCGTNHFAHENMVKRVIGGHWNMAPRLSKLAMEEKIEAYNLPQGTLTHLFRNIAGKKPGVITKVGLHTFVDPRVEGGKLNKKTAEDVVEVIQLGGEEWLWYKPFAVDVALIRGTFADERGNISIDREAVSLEILSMAQAAKSSGGIVIAQVESMVKFGSINPKNVKVPGISVDYVVITEQNKHMQTFAEQYNPSYSGEVNLSLNTRKAMPLDARKVIARRAAMELIPKAKVNLGIGIPEGVAMVACEEGVGDSMTLTVEAGPIGGIPSGGLSFGASCNPEAIIDQPYQFDFYDGGALDLAYLGLAETDQQGNINVSKFKGRVAGCGGFINISQNAKKVVFCGTFTARGLEVEVGNGQLKINKEGANKKFLKEVEQITFSGRYAQETGQAVVYVTERAVFRLTEEGMVLTEIAPGIDLQHDILQLMDFKPLIAEDIKVMDDRIFREEKICLEELIGVK